MQAGRNGVVPTGTAWRDAGITKSQIDRIPLSVAAGQSDAGRHRVGQIQPGPIAHYDAGVAGHFR
ncbi:hypothetical protein BLA18110_02711 [Burkholderia lata]|nr:hypothetical protein BLA18110_02711 [Burkholderia lata]